jgi:REP element-mobilizing transposase RayT
MSHSKVKIWVHAIFSTKNREPLIKQEIEKKVYNIVIHEFIEQSCPVEIINGMSEHVHILFLLNPQKSPSDVMKQVKGASSHKINNRNIIKSKFGWQVGYGAYSVSESQVPKVKEYIKNQKEHHKKMTFQEEYEKFIKYHGLF